MMAITRTSERPATVAAGTMAGAPRAGASASAAAASCRSAALRTSVMDVEPSLVQHEAPHVVLVQQMHVMGGDHDRRPELVQFDEQPQQPPPELGVHIAGRLV